MSHPVILSAARTALGKFQGSLLSLSATEIGAIAFRAALDRSLVSKSDVNEVILGNVVSAGVGMAPARQVALGAGLPETISCYSVNKVCGSGLQAVMLAAQSIKAGDNDVVLAGGTESMSNAPFLLPRVRQGLGYGHGKVLDALLNDGLECCIEKWHMGSAAEHIARRFEISRDAADRFALESQKRAVAAQLAGKFKAEIIPVELKQKKGPPVVFETDEGPRADTVLEKLSILKPAFEPTGIVTAGNASTLNDGAAAILITSENWAEKKGLKPLARILSYATSGVSPKDIFHAPALAVPDAIQKAGLQLSDIDLFELNEAFAVQSLSNLKALELSSERVNVHGGAIALGHPLGASGARCLTTLIYAMIDRNARYGCVSLCLGGGNAVAMVIEKI